MRVKVSYIHVIAKEVGVAREVVELDENASLKDLLAYLARRHGEAFKRYVYDDEKGEVKGYAIIAVNGKIVLRGKAGDLKLAEGDSVFFGIGAAGG